MAAAWRRLSTTVRSHLTACEAGMLRGRDLMPKAWNSRGLNYLY